MIKYDKTSIRALREKKGLTVREFADMLGYSRQHAYAAEKSPGIPNFKTIIKLSNTFGVPLYFFVKKVDDSGEEKK